MTVDTAYHILYIGALVVLAVFMALILLAAAVKKTVTDRLLCINIVGTMVIVSLGILSQMLKESYLLDVALIYTMISFITVLILALTFIPAKPKREIFGAPSADGAAQGTAGEENR